MVVGFVVGCTVGGVVSVVGAVCGGGFGMNTTATGVGGFVAGQGWLCLVWVLVLLWVKRLLM